MGSSTTRPYTLAAAGVAAEESPRHPVATSSWHSGHVAGPTPRPPPAPGLRTTHPAQLTRRRGSPATWHSSPPQLGGGATHAAQWVYPRHRTRGTPPTIPWGPWGVPCRHARRPMATKPRTAQPGRATASRTPSTNHIQQPDPNKRPTAAAASQSPARRQQFLLQQHLQQQQQQPRWQLNTCQRNTAPKHPSHHSYHRTTAAGRPTGDNTRPALPPSSSHPGRCGPARHSTTTQQRCFFFQRPPQFLKGRIRQALSFALVSITAAQTPVAGTRAWTLWLLLPRMLLHRPPGTKVLPKPIGIAARALFQRASGNNSSSKRAPTNQPSRRPSTTVSRA